MKQQSSSQEKGAALDEDLSTLVLKHSRRNPNDGRYELQEQYSFPLRRSTYVEIGSSSARDITIEDSYVSDAHGVLNARRIFDRWEISYTDQSQHGSLVGLPSSRREELNDRSIPILDNLNPETAYIHLGRKQAYLTKRPVRQDPLPQHRLRAYVEDADKH